MGSIQFNQTLIGPGEPVFIIAEIGINHNGDLDLAKKMIRSAKDNGADCVKLQTFKADRVVTANAPKAKYQLEVTDNKESQLEMLEKVELDLEAHREIKQFASDLDVLFLSTPYNFEDVDLLEAIGVGAYKVASGQIIEISFLEKIAKLNKPIFLSTGMATISEIGEAVQAIKDCGNQQIVLLQCTTNYPSEISDANLKVISSLQRTFGLPVGYSDHTLGNEAALAATALGACVLEKHFTLDKSLPGPDHTSSILPEELGQLVDSVRKVEKALGSEIKYPTEVEKQNAIGMRRSLTAACDINEGDTITSLMITFKRPSTGLAPRFYNVILGQKALHSISQDEMITLDMIQWQTK